MAKIKLKELSQLSIDNICRDLLNNKKRIDICKEYNISSGTLSSIVNKEGRVFKKEFHK